MSVCMLPISYLIGLYNMTLFFFSFLFNLSFGLEVTVMPDFLISQRIFVLTQQFMDGCDQSGSILVIVNIFLPFFRIWLFLLFHTLSCMLNNSIPLIFRVWTLMVRAAVFLFDLCCAWSRLLISSKIKWTGKDLKPIYNPFKYQLKHFIILQSSDPFSYFCLKQHLATLDKFSAFSWSWRFESNTVLLCFTIVCSASPILPGESWQLLDKDKNWQKEE